MGEQLYKKGLRRCYRCKIIFPLTKEYFCANRTQPRGFYYMCHKCRREYIREYAKEYYKKNREKCLERFCKYRRKNRIKILKQQKEWQKRNPDYRQKWVLAHWERILKQTREWKRKHRKICNLQKARHIARSKGAEGTYTLEEWENIKKKFSYQCAICGRKEPEIKLTADHIIPLSRGGSNYILNIQPLCLNCNCRKSAKVLLAKSA